MTSKKEDTSQDKDNQDVLKVIATTAENVDDRSNAYRRIQDEKFIKKQLLTVLDDYSWDMFNNQDLKKRKNYRYFILPLVKGLQNISDQDFLLNLILEIECPIPMKTSGMRQLYEQSYLEKIIDDVIFGTSLLSYAKRAYQGSLSSESMIPDFLSNIIFLATQRLESKNFSWERLQENPSLFSTQLRYLYLRYNHDPLFAKLELDRQISEENEAILEYIIRTYTIPKDMIRQLFEIFDHRLQMLLLSKLKPKSLSELKLSGNRAMRSVVDEIYKITQFKLKSAGVDNIDNQRLCDLIDFHPKDGTRLKLIHSSLPDLSKYANYPPENEENSDYFNHDQLNVLCMVVEHDPSWSIREAIIKKLPINYLSYLEIIDLEMEQFRDKLMLYD